MSNVMMAKSSLFGQMNSDDLDIVTLQNVTNVISLHFFSQMLPQTQTQAKKAHVKNN